MNNWSSERICDVCELIPVGKRYSKELVCGHGKIKVLDQSQADIFGWHDNSADIIASPESPVFTFANHTCSMRWMEEPFSVIQNVFPVRGISGETDTRFLYYASATSVVQDGYKGHFPLFRETIIKVPPLTEQKKIAEILSGIDTATKFVEAKIKKLKLIKTSVCQKEFPYDAYLSEKESGDNVSLQIRNLRDVADVVDCKHRTPVYAGKGFPVVRPRDVKESGIDFNQCIKTSASELDSLNDGINPRANDIVYSRNATLGVGALIESDTTFAIGQDVCILRSTGINARYFYYQLNSDSFFAQVENLVSGSTFKRINLSAIRGLGVITPSASEQSRVANILDHIDNSIFLLQRRRDKCIQLKKSLASDLLSGRKRVSI